MDTEITIRLAENGDAPLLTAFIFQIRREKVITQAQADISQLLATCNADASHSVYLAMMGRELVGYTVIHWCPFLMFGSSEAYISELFIASSIRGCGIGTKLFTKVEEDANARGCFRLMLNNFKQTEAYAREFYKKQGFIERTNVGNFVKELKKRTSL